MSTTIYTVEIPPIHYLLLGLETKTFSDENQEIAKEQALSYLSKVLKEAFAKELIEILDFKDDHSSWMKRITNLNDIKYITDNGNVNFEQILQCKINYRFNKYVQKNAVFNQNIHGNAQEKLDSYGFFALTRSQSDRPGKSTIFKIKNEEKRIIRSLSTVRKIDEQKLNYFDKLKIQIVKERFYDKEDNYQTQILNTDSYLEFEQIFLSFQNTHFITKYLFIPENYRKHLNEILDVLQSLYLTEYNFEFYTAVEIDGTQYEVYIHKSSSRTLTYSKTGKLYIRDFKGVKEVDKHTTISDILEIKTNDQFLEDISKFI